MMKGKRKLFAISFLADIAIIYIFLALLACIFYLHNTDMLGVIESDEYPELIRGFLRFSTANICYTFGLFAAISLFPLSANCYSSKAYKRIKAAAYLIAIFATVAINLSDAVYFHYTSKRFTATEFFFLDNSNSLQLVVKFLGENLDMVLYGILIICVWTFVYFALESSRYEFKTKNAHYALHVSVFILLAFLIVVGMRGGIDRQTRPITISNAAQYSTTAEKGAIILSNPFCILRTIENKPVYRANFMPTDEAGRIFSTRHDFSLDSLTVESQAGKNVIIFILESFSAEHSAKLYPELYPDFTLTPFLDSLMGEGLILREAYANGHKSIDALPSVLASIPSLDTPFATLPEALSPTDALGSILAEKGYSTWFFNGSERGSMGYVAYSRIAGINNFRTMEDYCKVHGNDDFDGYWGIWDGPFLKFMGETLDTIAQPFFATLFTLSSHHPFVVPDEYKEYLPEGKTKVHRPVAYVDRSFRELFNQIKESPWFMNTLFVFVADHVSSEKYGPQSMTSRGGTHIMAFYYTPDGSLKGEYTKTTQQIDIMPSVAALTGTKGVVHCFGRNIFSNDSTGFAINYTGTDFQWIEQDTAYIFDGTDSTNLRIRAFLQTYYDEISNKKFSFRKKE